MTLSIPTWNRCVLLLLTAVAVYFQTWADLWPFWENKNATYTHGTLIALIALWLVWRTRGSLSEVAATSSLPAQMLVLLLSGIWLLAARANVFIVHASLWPILAFAIVWGGVGWRAARRLTFPLCFLYFAIPVWDYLKPPLQMITSTVIGYLTGIAGLPATVDGPYITLPGGTIYIALDCSGAHFLCVALAVGVLAGVTRGDSLRTRTLILIIAGALSMIFNWLRILLIVFAYLHPALQHTLETVGHFTFGWWVFALDLLVFYFVLRLVPLSDPPAPPRVAIAREPPRSDGTIQFALAIGAAVLLPASSWALPRMYDDGRSPALTPISLPGTTGRTTPDFRWMPEFEGATWQDRAAFLMNDGRAIELYRNEYREQSQGKELISRGSPLFDPAIFSTRSSTIVYLRRDSEPQIEAIRVELLDKFKNRWIGLYTYVVDQHAVGNAWRAQLRIAFSSIYRHPSAGVLALAMPCSTDCSAAGAELDAAFVRAYGAPRLAPKEP